MKNFEDYLNEKLNVNNEHLVLNIKDAISKYIIGYMNTLEPDIKFITDKFGLKLEKDFRDSRFIIHMIGENLEYPVSLDSYQAEYELKLYDSDLQECTVLEGIIDDIFNQMIGNLDDDGYVEDEYLEVMLKDASLFNDFKQYIDDTEQDIEDYISPKIKEKYDYILKNELF